MMSALPYTACCLRGILVNRFATSAAMSLGPWPACWSPSEQVAALMPSRRLVLHTSTRDGRCRDRRQPGQRKQQRSPGSRRRLRWPPTRPGHPPQSSLPLDSLRPSRSARIDAGLGRVGDPATIENGTKGSCRSSALEPHLDRTLSPISTPLAVFRDPCCSRASPWWWRRCGQFGDACLTAS